MQSGGNGGHDTQLNDQMQQGKTTDPAESRTSRENLSVLVEKVLFWAKNSLRVSRDFVIIPASNKLYRFIFRTPVSVRVRRRL